MKHVSLIYAHELVNPLLERTMNKIETLKQKLSDWEAKINHFANTKNASAYEHATGIRYGLELAIAILEGPSNSKLKLDACKHSKTCILKPPSGCKERCQYFQTAHDLT